VIAVCQYRCQCRGVGSCEENDEMQCPSGTQKRVVQRAAGQPGACCNVYHCANGQCSPIDGPVMEELEM